MEVTTVVDRTELIQHTIRQRDQTIGDLQAWQVALLSMDPTQVSITDYQDRVQKVNQLNQDLTALKSGFSLGELAKPTGGPNTLPQLQKAIQQIMDQKILYYQHMTLFPTVTDAMYLCLLGMDASPLWEHLKTQIEQVKQFHHPIDLPDLLAEAQKLDTLRQQHIASQVGREMSLNENSVTEQFEKYDHHLRNTITILEQRKKTLYESSGASSTWQAENFQYYYWVEELHALNRAMHQKQQELTLYRLNSQFVLGKIHIPIPIPIPKSTPSPSPSPSPSQFQSPLTCRFIVRSTESGVGADVKAYQQFFATSYVADRTSHDEIMVDLNFHMELPFDSYLGQARVNLLMANYEYLIYGDPQKRRETIELLKKIDIVICKALITVEYCQKLKDEYHLTYQIVYTKHTTPITPVSQMGDVPQDETSWLHAAGKSKWKQTDTVLKAWVKHPEWPRLIVTCRKGCINNKYLEEVSYADAPNIQVMEFAEDLNRLQYQILNHLCPSIVEGYGHYLNEARAYGRFIVTSDYPPMNELVTNQSGILIPCTEKLVKPNSLDVKLCIISTEDFEKAMNTIFQIPLEQRRALGQQALKDYLKDNQFFTQTMKEILEKLRSGELRSPTAPLGELHSPIPPSVESAPSHPIVPRKVAVIIKKPNILPSTPAPAPAPAPVVEKNGLDLTTFKRLHDAIVRKKPECAPFTYEIVSPVITLLQNNQVEFNYASVRSFLTKHRKATTPSVIQLKNVGVAETTTASYISQIYGPV